MSKATPVQEFHESILYQVMKLHHGEVDIYNESAEEDPARNPWAGETENLPWFVSLDCAECHTGWPCRTFQIAALAFAEASEDEELSTPGENPVDGETPN